MRRRTGKTGLPPERSGSQFDCRRGSHDQTARQPRTPEFDTGHVFEETNRITGSEGDTAQHVPFPGDAVDLGEEMSSGTIVNIDQADSRIDYSRNPAVDEIQEEFPRARSSPRPLHG